MPGCAGRPLHEAVIYIRARSSRWGRRARGADGEADYAAVGELLAAAGLRHEPRDFRRVASMRSLYHWNADANQEY
jgi:hypothetical protein